MGKKFFLQSTDGWLAHCSSFYTGAQFSPCCDLSCQCSALLYVSLLSAKEPGRSWCCMVGPCHRPRQAAFNEAALSFVGSQSMAGAQPGLLGVPQESPGLPDHFDDQVRQSAVSWRLWGAPVGEESQENNV